MLVNKKLEAAPGFEDLNNELAKLKLGMASLVEAVQKVDYADHAPKHRPVRSYVSTFDADPSVSQSRSRLGVAWLCWEVCMLRRLLAQRGALKSRNFSEQTVYHQ
jgi:hypothetical protein